MREGRFFVDVVVGTEDGDAELAFAERALELSVFSQDTSGGGPVRLGGTWSSRLATARSRASLSVCCLTDAPGRGSAR